MNKFSKNRDDKQHKLRVNDQIRFSPVLVIKDGMNVGTLPILEAKRLAEEAGLDLVEVSPDARPPVCKIIDYGKYLYEQNKKDRENRKHAKATEMKEIQLRPMIAEHDMEIKVKSIKKFLEGGHKVHVKLNYFGRRAMAHTELGFEVMEKLISMLDGVGTPQSKPRLQGRCLDCIIDPAK